MRATASLVLSYRIERGTPPRKLKAATCPSMPVQKGFGALGGVGFDKARIGVGQVEAEEVDSLPAPADHRDRLAEVDLGVTRGMDEGNEHLPRSGLLLA